MRIRTTCKRCGRDVPTTSSGHTRAHACPHGRSCQVPYASRRRGERRTLCDDCFRGKQEPLPFGR